MKVVVYSTPTCGYCRLAKQFLTENNVTYEDVDVAVNEARATEMVQLSGQMGVPVIAITQDDGSQEVLVGFQQERLRELLKINK
ncbi:MAG TPA: glutaredoxin domain-containing protein [bacterium]|nr:glutaredoxin domain-containing protein [bacterium]